MKAVKRPCSADVLNIRKFQKADLFEIVHSAVAILHSVGSSCVVGERSTVKCSAQKAMALPDTLFMCAMPHITDVVLLNSGHLLISPTSSVVGSAIQNNTIWKVHL